MEKDHFEILLERIEDNTKLALEGVATINDRLDRQESQIAGLIAGQTKLEAGQATLEAGQATLEAGQAAMRKDLRELKNTAGLLHSIANNHEERLRKVEAAMEDHLAHHA